MPGPLMRYPILFDKWYQILSTLCFLPPSGSYIEVNGEKIHVRMGWAFRATFPKSAIVSFKTSDFRPLSRGVHGFSGKWLVNGAGHPLLSIEFAPEQKAFVLGFPVRLKQLWISLENPSALAKSLKET